MEDGRGKREWNSPVQNIMMNQFKEDENFVKFLIAEGIKSGSIGES